MLNLNVILSINLLIVLSSMESYAMEYCGTTFMINKTKQATITSGNPGKRYKEKTSCSWSFIGDPQCTPVITCDEFDIQKLDKDCSAEHLSISDGSGQGKRFCGDGGKNVQLKSKTRDLYVTFKTGVSNKRTTGFQCQIECASPLSKFPTGRRSPPFALKENPQCVCGLQNKDDRIVGGVDAKANEFPWLVSIVYKGTRMPHCGASIINDKYVLTAAHCFTGLKGPERYDILAHAHVLDQNIFVSNDPNAAFGEPHSIKGPGQNLPKYTDKDEKTQRYSIKKITIHPFFEPQFDYDLAILELEKKIDFTKPGAPTPICLPPAYGGFHDDYVGKVPIVAGWGLAFEGAGGTTRLLQKLNAPIINLQVCSDYGLGYLTPRMLCAGYKDGGYDSCAGDSGGPLAYQKSNKQWEQLGIVSFGLGCARKLRPGIYSRIIEMRAWINQNTPGATWCKTK